MERDMSSVLDGWVSVEIPASVVNDKLSKTEEYKLKRVIVADDDENIIELFKRGLRQQARLSWAEDGYETVERVATLPSADLLILDWNMPGLTGLKALKTIEMMTKTDPHLGEIWEGRRIPYVICSVKSPEELEVPPLEHFYLVDYWQKPLMVNELKQKLEEVFNRIKGGAACN